MPHAEDYASYSRNTTNSFNESTPSSDETTSFEFTDRVCISTVLDQGNEEELVERMMEMHTVHKFKILPDSLHFDGIYQQSLMSDLYQDRILPHVLFALAGKLSDVICIGSSSSLSQSVLSVNGFFRKSIQNILLSNFSISLSAWCISERGTICDLVLQSITRQHMTTPYLTLQPSEQEDTFCTIGGGLKTIDVDRIEEMSNLETTLQETMQDDLKSHMVLTLHCTDKDGTAGQVRFVLISDGCNVNDVCPQWFSEVLDRDIDSTDVQPVALSVLWDICPLLFPNDMATTIPTSILGHVSLQESQLEITCRTMEILSMLYGREQPDLYLEDLYSEVSTPQTGRLNVDELVSPSEYSMNGQFTRISPAEGYHDAEPKECPLSTLDLGSSRASLESTFTIPGDDEYTARYREAVQLEFRKSNNALRNSQLECSQLAKHLSQKSELVLRQKGEIKTARRTLRNTKAQLQRSLLRVSQHKEEQDKVISDFNRAKKAFFLVKEKRQLESENTTSMEEKYKTEIVQLQLTLNEERRTIESQRMHNFELEVQLEVQKQKTKTGQAALLAQRKRETYLQRELSKGVHTLQPGKDASFEVKEIKRKWMMAQVKCRQLQTHLNLARRFNGEGVTSSSHKREEMSLWTKQLLPKPQDSKGSNFTATVLRDALNLEFPMQEEKEDGSEYSSESCENEEVSSFIEKTNSTHENETTSWEEGEDGEDSSEHSYRLPSPLRTYVEEKEEESNERNKVSRRMFKARSTINVLSLNESSRSTRNGFISPHEDEIEAERNEYYDASSVSSASPPPTHYHNSFEKEPDNGHSSSFAHYLQLYCRDSATAACSTSMSMP